MEYLAALSDELPLDTWRRIVRRAAIDAENGDSRAREWLSKYVLGPGPSLDRVSSGDALRLFELAVEEAQGKTVDDRIQRRVAADQAPPAPCPSLDDLLRQFGAK